MRIVFALGGSIVVPDNVDTEFVSNFAEFAKGLLAENQLAIIVGGGKNARRAIELLKKHGANDVDCDYAGIDASRENAQTIANAMGVPSPALGTLKPAKRFFDENGIVIMGGTEPGHSTDAVAALLAEYIGADLLIKTTDVKGIYDSDPAKNKSAKLLKELSVAELEKMVSSLSQGAGNYRLFDLLAVKILERSGTKCIALDGHDLKNMKAAIQGKSFVGTTIIPVKK